MSKNQEHSPYWTWVARHSKYDSNGNAYESTDANPDHLSEEDILIHRSELTDEQEECVAAYYQAIARGALKKLAPRQREVWKMHFFRWCSEEEISLELGLSVKTVRKHLELAAEKIKIEVDKQKKKRERLNGNYFNDGFKKKVEVRGEAPTDKEFGERLLKHEAEIDKFCKKHPELRKNL